jgi:hypothetical protein
MKDSPFVPVLLTEKVAYSIAYCRLTGLLSAQSTYQQQ